LACVWETGGDRQQILELMPPSYEPKLRSGIVGIGDRDVLKRFKEIFREDPSPHLPIEATPEMIENISKAVGYRVDFGSRFPITQAIAQITSDFTEAIEEVESPRVALPVHALTITKEGYRPFHAYLHSPGNPDKGRWLTTPTDKLSLLDRTVPRAPRDIDPRKAVQLFD